MANLYRNKTTLVYSKKNKPTKSLFLRALNQLATKTQDLNNGTASAVQVTTALEFYTVQQKFTDFGKFVISDGGGFVDFEGKGLNSICDFYRYLESRGVSLAEEFVAAAGLVYKDVNGGVVGISYVADFSSPKTIITEA